MPPVFLEVHGVQKSRDQADIFFQQFPLFQQCFFTGDIKCVAAQGYEDKHLPVFKMERQGNIELSIEIIHPLDHLCRHDTHSVPRIVCEDLKALPKGREFRFHPLPLARIRKYAGNAEVAPYHLHRALDR